MGPDPVAPVGQTVAEAESGAGKFTGKDDDYQQTPAPVRTADPSPQITYTTDPGESQDSGFSGNQYSFDTGYEDRSYFGDISGPSLRVVVLAWLTVAVLILCRATAL